MDKILVDSIINKLKNCTGKVGFYYKNLITKEKLAYQENESFIAASIIKLPIFAQVIKVSSEHRLDLGKEVQIRKEDILPSCGAINLFSSEPRLDLRTICNFMIALSDNTATNIMIRECGIAALNAGFQEMGLMKTRLERPLLTRLPLWQEKITTLRRRKSQCCWKACMKNGSSVRQFLRIFYRR